MRPEYGTSLRPWHHRTFDAGQKNASIFGEKLGARQGGLEKPADELGLTVGKGFFENAGRVGARHCLGDLEFCCGGEKAAVADQSNLNPSPYRSGHSS
jgi:hypothetical protein